MNASADASARLIVALDVPTVAEARAIVAEVGPSVTFYKIGLYLQWDREVHRFIDELGESGARVFIDFKYSDIGESMRGGVAGAARAGASFLTIQGSGGVNKAALEAAVAGRGDADLKLLLVTFLTSLSAADLKGFGVAGAVEDVVLDRVRAAEDAGLDGVIASGREVRAIREMVGADFLIVTPGIRAKGAATDDHKRAVTPGEAITNGADYLVVGRPIIHARDRRAAAIAIADEMRAAFDTG
jgi:orotidine-5'-phosphate decarboxylase